MNDSPYHRTNINLHTSDYKFLVARFGHGWTEKVREWVKHQVRIERIKAEDRFDVEQTQTYILPKPESR